MKKDDLKVRLNIYKELKERDQNMLALMAVDMSIAALANDNELAEVLCAEVELFSNRVKDLTTVIEKIETHLNK